ncbi:hypothetical protein [Usitatibacter palustris]|nr:hypothetical protein [Usitatibacter palustris]
MQFIGGTGKRAFPINGIDNLQRFQGEFHSGDLNKMVKSIR